MVGYWCALREGASTPIVVGAARDVTERVLTARALRASEDRFTTAFHASPIAMAITTVDEGRYLEINDAFERQIGYTRDEIVGRTSLELNVWPSPDDRAAMIATLERQKTRQGSERAVSHEVGQPDHHLVLGWSHLARRTAVRAGGHRRHHGAKAGGRRASGERIEIPSPGRNGAVRHLHLPAGRAFCYVNPRVEAFTGVLVPRAPLHECLGSGPPGFRGRSRACAPQDRSRPEGVPVRFECQVASRSGETRWIDFTATPTEYEGKPAILGTTFDITASKRHEQEANERAAVLRTLIANSPFGILVGDKDHRIQIYNAAFQHMFRYSGEDLLEGSDDLVGLPGESGSQRNQ